MLRFLILTFLFSSTFVFAFENPSEAQIKKQKQLVKETFEKAEKIYSGKPLNYSLDFRPDQTGDFTKAMDQASSQGIKELVSAPKKLVVCISLGLPKSYLKAIAAEAKNVGATLAIRGLYEDLKTTMKMMSDLFPNSGLVIDPEIFTKNNIDAVPAFILESGKISATAKGSTSIRYFLDMILRVGTKQERDLAFEFVSLY